MQHTARIVVAVDLSAVIFVALALAWAVYLIPKALKHHDEMASDRLLEGHSDKARILSRKGKTTVVEVDEEVLEEVAPAAPAAAQVPAPGPVVTTTAAPTVAPAPAPLVTRSTARKAAQRRRRVLGVLVAILVVVWAATWLAYLPIWAPGVPGALVVAWLVIARLSVRKQQRARRARPVPSPARSVASALVDLGHPSQSAADLSGHARVHTSSTSNADEFLEQLADEDTAGLAREDIEAALADDGSLWDPLPMTLPTYVNKARARRTVRTIELTGINSSGHDESDSVLARQAAESAQAAEESEAQRKAAGA
jgi:hypothetical protein